MQRGTLADARGAPCTSWGVAASAAGRRTSEGPAAVLGGMGRLRLPLVCALGVLLLMPQGTAAGGWWSYIDVNRSHVAPGQRVELDETVAFSSAAAAEAAQ